MNENELKQLAELLIKYHNKIAAGTDKDASIYGRKMDCALIKDTHGTLARHLPMEVWGETTRGFKPCL